MNKKQSNEDQKINLSNPSTKLADEREPTRDTLKSSTLTRSGTLSSRKSSSKTNEQTEHDDEEQSERPFNEQQATTKCKINLSCVSLDEAKYLFVKHLKLCSVSFEKHNHSKIFISILCIVKSLILNLLVFYMSNS